MAAFSAAGAGGSGTCAKCCSQRGYLQPRLQGRVGLTGAVLTASAVFALQHIAQRRHIADDGVQQRRMERNSRLRSVDINIARLDVQVFIGNNAAWAEHRGLFG